MHLHIDLISNKIVQLYNLNNIMDNEGWVYIKITKSMFGLPQASLFGKKLLKKDLCHMTSTNANLYKNHENVCGDNSHLFK